jgi:pyruvate, water dikinase
MTLLKHLTTAFLFIFLIVPNLYCQQKPCSYNGGTIDYLSEINCESDFDIVQSLPLKNNFSNIKSVKVIYDIDKNIIYYADSKRYKYHYSFCSEYLRAYNNLEDFNTIEYNDSKSRKFAICNLNLYTASNICTVEFFPDDKINERYVEKVFNKIKATTYFANHLKILNNSWTTEHWQPNTSLSFIDVDVIYKGQKFQAMKTGVVFGYLRFINKDSLTQKHITEKDILVINGLPNNLPLCAATVTTAFQTPLCHINILSQNRNTPNCMIKNAYDNAELLKLKNKLVYFLVQNDTLIIKETTEYEAIKFWNKSKSKKLISLICNIENDKLIWAKDLSIKDINTVGGKAANMGELTRIRFNNHQQIPTPEKAFAIPFYFYKKHIQDNHIEPLITALLNDKEIINDKERLEKRLEDIRTAIVDGKINNELIKMIAEKIDDYKEHNFRFRSSTNAEDVPGFNGAGLYDSKTGNISNPKKPVDKAIKVVWASLWERRAFEERYYFNIDQTNLAMGIMVNKAFGTEEANGVAVTKNLYRDDYPAFTINVQLGETSVVQPNDSIRTEQFLINFSSQMSGNDDDLAVDYICHSSLQPKKPILSAKEIKELAAYLMAIKQHYWVLYGRLKNINFENFAMDVEFKLDKNTRKIFIKQARTF